MWKFKAVGHTAQGELVPGGGPLTVRHNAVFERPDDAEVSAGLLRGCDEPSLRLARSFDGGPLADGMADIDAAVAAERRTRQQRS